MKRYANNSGNSGVVAYESGENFIRLRFRDRNDVYTYSYASAGKKSIDIMKKLAESGKGLSTFITRNVRDKFEH